jgi:DNA ligase-associated metallophosphoesterase
MSQSIIIKGEELLLLREKAVYWISKRTLLVADLHLGKANHFRRAGIAVPHRPTEETLNRLENLIVLFSVQHLIILGDLFHSEKNAEWDIFIRWLNQQQVRTSVVLGNHDRFMQDTFQQSELHVYENALIIPPFTLQHHPQENNESDNHFCIAGHIHPAYSLKTKARQRLVLPCFVFASNQLILPAFGAFTGKQIITIKSNERYFITTNEAVTEIPNY